MTRKLHLLLAEDSAQDAELVLRTLKRGGFSVQSRRVASAAALRAALKKQAWDAVVSDHRMPGFSGMEALRIVRDADQDLPFILISGVMGEEAAVAALRAGAGDYILKSNLGRLASVLERELKEWETRIANRLAQRRLVESEAGLRRAQAMAKLAHVITGPDGAFESWSESLPHLIGATAGRMPKGMRDWLEFVHPEDVAVLRESAIVAGRALVRSEVAYRLRSASGSWIDVRQVMEPLYALGGAVAGTRWFNTLQDVTDQQRSADRIRRLNRVYAVLSGINTLIVRARSADELFGEACKIAVNAGQFKLAWIGVVDPEGKRVTPVAWQGASEEFVQAIPKDLGMAADQHRGPVALAVEGRKPVVSDDMTNDPRIKLKTEAAALGLRALVVMPLLIADEVAGVLQLCAGESGFFDAEEMKLLVELASDIAFAMAHLETVGKVEYLAFHDPLTGLPNRAVLGDRLGQMMSSAHRDRRMAHVAFFDVERFRQINDTLGRSAGDEFLIAVAERLRVAIRSEDTLARIGGDVFAIAMSSIANVSDASHLISNTLAKAFADPVVINGQELRVTLKAGVAVFPGDGESAEVLCRNAEAALKKAKESGERLVYYTAEMNARVADALALENKLRGALAADQFVLRYQPKVDTRTRQLLGLEALIRWNDPELGLVPPGKFIPLMEETGIILAAGRWALGRAVADVQAWRAKGYAAPRVAVNVSQIQLRQRDFVKTVLDALDGFGDDEVTLDLEITESMLMQNLEPTIQALQTLRGVGIETALDDFGTGYSSLAYVARLPIKALKIDRSFVIEMASSKYARAIVETIISLAHSLGLQVIAEGVDAEEQAAKLVELGCDQMQGFLISKPVPAEQIEAMLAKA